MRYFAHSLAISSLLLLWHLSAFAAGLRVNPVYLSLSAAQPITEVNITDTGSQAITIALHPWLWQQQNGRDNYSPTQNILVTPPIVRILPGQTQLIRLGLESTPEASQETAYRLFIREILPAAAHHAGKIQLVLQISLPVFVAPLQPERLQSDWLAQATPDHHLRLRWINTGNAHLRLARLSITNLRTDQKLQLTQLVYLLPQQQHGWPTFGLTVQKGDPLLIDSLTGDDDTHVKIQVT